MKMSTPADHTSEALILQLLRADDERGFTMMYRQYWEELFVTAAKALRGKEEAADVVQDVFLSIWNRRHEINIEGSLAAYLQTSVRYKAIHYIEKNITRRDYLTILTETAIHTLPANAEFRLQLKEVQETIHQVIANMPARMQEVYRLSRQNQLTHKEIAEKLGITAETVKKHIQHALQLIKEALSSGAVCIPWLLYQLLF